MTLVQLRHFVALAEAGSFRRAAAQVFLTQPALSRSIQALESAWACRLFDRVGRSVELTPEGRGRLAAARSLLEEARRLSAPDPGTSGGGALRGALRIGMGSGAGALLMRPLLLEVSLHHPELWIQIARGHTDLLVQRLRERSLDALVIDARSLRPEPDLQTQVLHEMPGAFLVRPGHPLLSATPPLRFADVAAYPIASTPLSDEVARILVERYGIDAAPQACIRLQSEEISSLVDVVRRSQAVLIAARGTAPELEALVLDPPLQAQARFGLVTLARRTEPVGLPLVRQLMQEVMGPSVSATSGNRAVRRRGLPDARPDDQQDAPRGARPDGPKDGRRRTLRRADGP